MTDSNATDELRKLLDERGVEYDDYRPTDDCSDTTWSLGDGNNATYTTYKNGATSLEIVLYDLTPAQAIAATLGSEREKQLELLVNQLWYLVNHRSGYGYAAALEAIEELGIEVDA